MNCHHPDIDCLCADDDVEHEICPYLTTNEEGESWALMLLAIVTLVAVGGCIAQFIADCNS